MSAHTPTPWYVQPFARGMPEIRAANGAEIAEIFPFNFDADDPQTMANARYIVRACNAHDELVAALESAMAVLCGDEMNKSSLIKALTEGRAALAKAKGEA